MQQNEKILIIGGGLSGLTLAYLLSKQKVFATILEASSRLGGRIQTVKGENDTPLELGATWFSEIHTNLIALLNDLGLNKYPQYTKGKSFFQSQSFEPPQEFYIPETESPSYRIAGGTENIIKTLSRKIDPKLINLNTKVVSVNETDNKLIVESEDGDKIVADKVILSLPPQLISSAIKFSPKLPNNTLSILPTVQTWMAGAIKFVLEYSEPFWIKNGYSGMAYSHEGIVSELYDHTNFEGNKYGLTGFLNSSSSHYSKERRKKFVLNQLEKIFVKDASKPLAYYDKIWTDKYILDGNEVINQPHQNNGHHFLQESYMNGKLFFSGTESVLEFSGYMEGAVLAAKKINEKVLKL